MVRLDDSLGKSFLLAHSSGGRYQVVLHGVEVGGIWVESDELQDLFPSFVSEVREGEPKQKPVFFVPYAHILLLVAASTVL